MRSLIISQFAKYLSILLARAELDLNRTPAAITQLHDRRPPPRHHCRGVEHLTIQRLGQQPQVAEHVCLEQQPQTLQILEQAIGAGSEGRHRQGGVATLTPGDQVQGCPGTKVGGAQVVGRGSQCSRCRISNAE